MRLVDDGLPAAARGIVWDIGIFATGPYLEDWPLYRKAPGGDLLKSGAPGLKISEVQERFETGQRTCRCDAHAFFSAG